VYKAQAGDKTDNYNVSGGTFRLDLEKTGPSQVCYSDAEQTVVYTYVATNNGGVPLYNVAITDDKVTVVTGDTDLGSGAWATFTESYVIPGGTTGSVVNTADATANLRDDDSSLWIDSNQVSWTVEIVDPACTIDGPPGQVCTNDTGLTFTGPVGPYTYAWSVTGGTIVSGQYGQVMTWDAPSGEGWGDVTLVVSQAIDGDVCTSTCAERVWVDRCCIEPTVTDPTSLSCVCENDSVSFSVTATGTPAPQYEWRKGGAALSNGGNISGADTAMLTINPVSAADEGSYTCYVWIDECGDALSAAATLDVDNEPPTFTCPTGSDLGCNPASLPDCDSVKALVTGLDDNCDPSPRLDCEAGAITGTCDKSQTFTLTATDDCGNTSDPCYVTYTWTDDTVPPEITCPADESVQCAGDVPPADVNSVQASDNCGTPTVTHRGDVSDGQTCPETITRTYRATDACGNYVASARRSSRWTTRKILCWRAVRRM